MDKGGAKAERGYPGPTRIRLGAQNRQKSPILNPKILSLKHPDFCLLKFGCLFYRIYLQPPEVPTLLGTGPTRGIGNSNTGGGGA